MFTCHYPSQWVSMNGAVTEEKQMLSKSFTPDPTRGAQMPTSWIWLRSKSGRPPLGKYYVTSRPFIVLHSKWEKLFLYCKFTGNVLEFHFQFQGTLGTLHGTQINTLPENCIGIAFYCRSFDAKVMTEKKENGKKTCENFRYQIKKLPDEIVPDKCRHKVRWCMNQT